MTRLICVLLPLLLWLPVTAQNDSDVGGKKLSLAKAMDSSLLEAALPKHFFEKVEKAQDKDAEKIRKQQQKLLKKLQRQEDKIYGQLAKIDCLKAKEYFAGVQEKYSALRQKLDGKTKVLKGAASSPYIPRMDSLSSLLKFLGPIAGVKDKAGNALAAVDGLKAQLAQAGELKNFLAEREGMLKSLTQQFTQLPTSVTKSLGSYSKQVYYYQERLKGWRETLNDPKKTEELALKILNKVPAFQQFMQQNGELAQLFGPASAGTTSGAGGTSLAGLQTRASVQQLLQQQLGSGGVNPQQHIQQQLGAAQAELGKLKQKLEGLKSGGVGSGDGNMPDFKPNGQKTKPFLKRLEYGWNLQTGSRGAYSFPSSNDLGASVGYKFNDRLVAGVGIAYKFGLGTGWNKIAFTSDGIGIRSFVDFKISSPQKGLRALFSNIWLSGGYEQNYWAKFKNIPELRKVAWQTSGLVGISKKIQYKKREAKMSVLYDFIKRRLPGEPPIIYRIAYNL